LALLVGAVALVLIHLSLTYAILGELDSRLIILDGGIAIVGLAVAFWYVGSLVEARQRHSLELVLMEVLTVPRDIAGTSQAALDALVRGGLADAATIAVADDTDSAMHPIAAVGYPEGWPASAEPERQPDATERPSVVREREPHRWVTPLADRVARQPWVARVPLSSGDDPIGLLLLTSARPSLLRDAQLLETLGTQLSAALDHAAMYEAAYQR